MKQFLIPAFVLLAVSAAPAFAADPMKPAGAMASDDHMMAADAMMKPMSKTDMAKMARCQKMKPAAAEKNAKCVKLMAMHSESKM